MSGSEAGITIAETTCGVSERSCETAARGVEAASEIVDIESAEGEYDLE